MATMSQTFHKFTGATLDAAYQEMVKSLGERATVVRTTQVARKGLAGLVGGKVYEITATVREEAPKSAGRKLTPAEKRYAKGLAEDNPLPAPAATPPKGAVVTDPKTLEHFEQVVRAAQERMGLQGLSGKKPAPSAPRSAPQIAAPTPPPASASLPATGPTTSAAPELLLFPSSGKSAGIGEDVQDQIAEIRDMLQVLMVEQPPVGMPELCVEHYRYLVEQGLTRKDAALLTAAVGENNTRELLQDPEIFRERLNFEIRKRIRTTGGAALLGGPRRVVALVGATGVGKTTNLAKLAALFSVRDTLKVGLITCDMYRVAAAAQLDVYAKIMNLPMLTVNEPGEMATALNEFRKFDVVLIDTAGGSQFNEKQVLELTALLETAQPDEVLLLLAANTEFETMAEVARGFAPLKPTSLFFTKLDETRRYGQIFSMMMETGLPAAYFSTGQEVPADMEVVRPARVAKLLLDKGEDISGPSGS
jgi:flagellar biosynthesis protein FlhF